MDYMHTRGFLHRDIKPENFIINRDTLEVKMIDFGTSREVYNQKPPYTAYVSTRWYRAPECALRTYYYGPQSDIFAIGCVMAELFLGMPIFPGQSELNQVDTIFKILGTPPKEHWREGYELALKRNYTFTVHKKIPLKYLIEDVSSECLDIIDRMFAVNPQFRPSASEILASPYFKSCNLSKLLGKGGFVTTHGNLAFGVVSPNGGDFPQMKASRLQSDDRRGAAGQEELNPQGFLQGRRSSMQTNQPA
jgi:serine/threonine protein kinase